VQLQQVTMNLIINSIGAMNDVDGTRELGNPSQGLKTSNFKCPSAIPAWGFPRSGRTRSSMRFLRPSLTALAWDYGSAARSSNRMAAGCGLPITLRAVRAFFHPTHRGRGVAILTYELRAGCCLYCRLDPPKLNGAVERANRTHTEEFYQLTPCSLEMKTLNCELRQWEKIYNTVRPHHPVQRAKLDVKPQFLENSAVLTHVPEIREHEDAGRFKDTCDFAAGLGTSFARVDVVKAEI
jgi:hypothetical protein